MKFILFDVCDVDKININKINICDGVNLNEILFTKKLLDFMNTEPQKILDKLRYKIYDKKVEKIILKSLGQYNMKWHYILSKKLQKGNKYLTNKSLQLLGHRYTPENEMNSNIFKYIDEYVASNKKIKSHQLKVLLVASERNIDISLLTNLIREYKSVNIYLKDSPSVYLLNKIKEINNIEGTTIEIISKERKSFLEYNIIFFVDDFKENYPRFRLNKNSQIIDLTTTKQDKYNSNVIYINDFVNEWNTNSKSIEELRLRYNSIEVAGVIKKITNILDKS